MGAGYQRKGIGSCWDQRDPMMHLMSGAAVAAVADFEVPAPCLQAVQPASL